MKDLKPFFSYYGGKYRTAQYYPKPEYDSIVEPFAGSAGYSVRNYEHNVILYDTNPIIAGLWDYLIKVKTNEIMKLPDEIVHIDELTNIPQESKWLIGFWLNKGCTGPGKTPSKWMREDIAKGYWGPEIKKRIAFQVNYIRHWKVYCASYENVKNFPSSWFVDPPYNNVSGRIYVKKFTELKRPKPFNHTLCRCPVDTA